MSPQAKFDASRPEGRCIACAYNLRGLPSGVCPECGTPICKRIDCVNVAEYDLIKSAFDEEGVRYDGADPRSGVRGAMHLLAGMEGGGHFYIHPEDDATALEILDAIGYGGHAPIVDRAEPICPHCGGSIAGVQNEECPACHGAFVWVDVESESDDQLA